MLSQRSNLSPRHRTFGTVCLRNSIGPVHGDRKSGQASCHSVSCFRSDCHQGIIGAAVAPNGTPMQSIMPVQSAWRHAVLSRGQMRCCAAEDDALDVRSGSESMMSADEQEAVNGRVSGKDRVFTFER
jgi:hypothetical protein